MSEGYPSQNGAERNGHAGGQGDAAPTDDHHRRADARMLIRAIYNGWLADTSKFQDALTRLEGLARESKDERVRASCNVAITKLVAEAARFEAEEDKRARLDAGEPTENTRVYTVEFDRRG